MVRVTSELTEITVIGDDDTGLIARITSLLFKRGINIEDLDQAVRQGLFRMTMHADTSKMDGSKADLRRALDDLCAELGMDVQVRFPADRKTRQVAVLATKESHCLNALFDAWNSGDPEAEIGVVVANHDDLAPIVESHDVPFYDIGDADGVPDEEWLLDILTEYDIDLVVLARYMRILSPKVVFRYENRIINVHPSLLPAFPGAEAYRQALEKGVRVTGVTAHYVTTDLDQGPIITQRAFNVPDDATIHDMERRGQPLEAEALVEAVRLHLENALVVGRGRTRLRGSDGDLGLPVEIERLNPNQPVDNRQT